MTIFGVRSHDPQDVINKVTTLATTAKGFGVPTILWSAGVDSIGGEVFLEIRSVFPDQPILDRTSLNAWEDRAVRDAVLATGRRNILMAGLWTEACLAFTALDSRARRATGCWRSRTRLGGRAQRPTSGRCSA
jgi:nicotinamidase-related amidase